MAKILTIVVPAYNAEMFLETNLRSFCVPEMLGNMEVLIINDGSTDGTESIAERYASEYPDTYRLINKENGGYGSCINIGIKEATGRYFKVVDAADWVDPDDFWEVMNFLESTGSDFVSAGIMLAQDEGQSDVSEFKTKPEFKEPFKNIQYTAEYKFDEIADRICVKMLNLIQKTELLRKMPFPLDDIDSFVDYEYVTYPVPKVQTITFLQNIYYRRRVKSEIVADSLEKRIAALDDANTALDSLLHFYDILGNGVFCTEQKRRYIAAMTADLAAEKMDILLCRPESDAVKQEIMGFDADLKRAYPDIYKANRDKTVKRLRSSGFMLYKNESKAARKQKKKD